MTDEIKHEIKVKQGNIVRLINSASVTWADEAERDLYHIVRHCFAYANEAERLEAENSRLKEVKGDNMKDKPIYERR